MSGKLVHKLIHRLRIKILSLRLPFPSIHHPDSSLKGRSLFSCVYPPLLPRTNKHTTLSTMTTPDLHNAKPDSIAGAENAPSAEPDFAAGLAFLKSKIKSLPHQPGVYRMFDAEDNSLYVGKARHLARRVTSYTQPIRLSNRLMQMVALTRRLEITVTNSEVEALLLESNLIKQHRPRFNILLKDDKSFAYILLTGDHPYPQMTKHRGAQKRKGIISAPLPQLARFNRTLSSLSKAFFAAQLHRQLL